MAQEAPEFHTEAVEAGDGPAGATARFPFDRLTAERFRNAFPAARWRDDLGAWFVPGTTAVKRVSAWQAREWSGVLTYADQRGRDAYTFEPLVSPYLEAANELVVRTPYSRTVIETLRTVPWARWDPAAKAWLVPFRSLEELRQRWPVIEAAAQRAEPAERRKRAEGGEAEREAAAEKRRHRYPVPEDALPPLGRVVMTALGCIVVENVAGELADPAVTARWYPEVAPGEATLIWAEWRRPTHAELVATWPARHPPSPAERARGWWQPDIETLRPERRKAASLERAQATRAARRSTPDGNLGKDEPTR